MSEKLKTAYDLAFGLIGVILMFTVTALLFSHFQIQEFESTGGQLELMFSDSAQEEYETMHDVRLLSGVASLIMVGAITSMSPKYYKLHSNPQWEVKKGIGSGIVLVLLGMVFYLVISQDLIVDAIGLGMVLFGLYSTLGNSAYLVLLNSDAAQSTSTSNGSYCSDCGNAVSSSDMFCPGCGSKL